MSWKLEAIKLHEQGMSWRSIADHLGAAKSSVSDFLRKETKGYVRPAEVVQSREEYTVRKKDCGDKDKRESDFNRPKILFYDIETAPMKAHLWTMWQQGVGLNQIETDWHMLSFCCKWAHSDEIFYYDQRSAKDIEDDYELVLKLWHFLNEADVVVGHNCKRFDTKKANSRFILNGLPKPSSFRQVDTLEIAKRQFGFSSNKLEYLTDNLCVTTKKSNHNKFPGHTLWVECMKGNLEAWVEMKAYNIDDVLSLEELYHTLSSWDNRLPNFDIYVDGVLDMSEWEKDGYVYTNLGKYQRYRNKRTGQQKRSRINLLTKDKRDSLLANIV